MALLNQISTAIQLWSNFLFQWILVHYDVRAVMNAHVVCTLACARVPEKQWNLYVHIALAPLSQQVDFGYLAPSGVAF